MKKRLKYFYDLELKFNVIDVTNRSFSLIFKSETILKISFFYFFIYFFSKKFFLTIFSFSLVLIISSIIGLSRFPIILFILIIYNFLDNYKYQFNNKNYLFSYFLFLIFAIWKMYKLTIEIINMDRSINPYYLFFINNCIEYFIYKIFQKIGKNLGLQDIPDNFKKKHKTVVFQLGGTLIYINFILLIICNYLLNNKVMELDKIHFFVNFWFNYNLYSRPD